MKTDPGQTADIAVPVPEHVPSITTAAVVIRREMKDETDEALLIYLSTATVDSRGDGFVLSCITLTITTRDPRLQRREAFWIITIQEVCSGPETYL